MTDEISAWLFPPGFCQCGCGRKAPMAKRNLPCRGWILGEPIQFVKGHSPAKSQEVKERNFWARMRLTATGCWEWLGPRDDKGYGRTWDVLSARGSNLKAHQISFRLLRGFPPEGTELDHTCRNRGCINPQHLDPVSHGVNMRRGKNTKLSVADVAFIRGRSESRSAMAERFKVSIETVNSIVYRKGKYRKNPAEEIAA